MARLINDDNTMCAVFLRRLPSLQHLPAAFNDINTMLARVQSITEFKGGIVPCPPSEPLHKAKKKA